MYCDVAFANNADLSSQLVRIVLLIEDNHNINPISHRSYKSQRVTRFVLSAEVIVFADLSDDALVIHKKLEFVLRQLIPEHILTDSKSLLDISTGSRTSQKQIILDIYAARQEYKEQEISNIGFVRSSHNFADDLHKPEVQAKLYQLLTTA